MLGFLKHPKTMCFNRQKMVIHDLDAPWFHQDGWHARNMRFWAKDMVAVVRVMSEMIGIPNL